MATVHPYKGYLNTDFRFYANGNKEIPYTIFYDNSENTVPVLSGVITPNIPHSITLKAPGEYKVVFDDGSSSNIIVEDGYKFGGSAFKNSFIFDETTWCFIIMNDRTYFYNRDSHESYIETISPDTIKIISSDYILLENNGQDEKTIYSLIDQRPILNVSNIVFYNNEVVIWKEISDENVDNLKIYSLQERCVVKSIIVDKFIVDIDSNAIIYITDSTLNRQELSLPLKGKHIYQIYGKLTSLVAPNIAISIDKRYHYSYICVFDTREDRELSRFRVEEAIASINSDIIIDINSNIEKIKRFNLSQIGCEEARIKVTFDTFIFYPTNWDIYCIIKKFTYERSINSATNTTTYTVKSLSNEKEYTFENDLNEITIRDNVICFSNYRESLIFGMNISPEYSKDVSIYIHNQDVLQSIDGNISILNDYFGWKSFGDAKYSFRYFDEFGIIKNEDNDTYLNLYGETINGYASILYSPNKHLIIGNKTILMTGEVLPNLSTSFSKSRKLGLTKDIDGISLLIIDGEDIIRKKILSDLYDPSSYKSVLLSEDGSQIMYRDKKQTVILDVKSGLADKYDNMSYIKDINGIRPQFSRRPGSLQPRLINPVTGQILSAERMPEYQFISPNGLLYADTEIKKYVETWDLITNKNLSEAELRSIKENFKNENKRQLFIEDNLLFFKKKCAENNWKERPDKVLIKNLLCLNYSEFTNLFLQERGIAYIRDKKNDSVVARIALGSPLWFINYVSFSYDNRYVAIAGRYPNDSNYVGLFLVYDLIEKKEIITKRNSWAVWMTSFNNQNHVAAYSGEPITYDSILSNIANDVCVNSHQGYSFLTFSPDGALAALSNQGYVSKYDKYGIERAEWGHMPSCDVYIVKSCKMDLVLLKFSDLSKSGIEGLSDKEHNFPKSVTSVSFSNDNKRLMMVGNDGVVIIRNLHLEDNAGE